MKKPAERQLQKNDNNKSTKVYVAGKVAKNSSHGTHYWRDEFLDDLTKLSGLKFINFDPTKTDLDHNNPEDIFACDSYLISQVDVVICYLSDDISVGCSQEILIAKFFKKPVIALAPYGGKFNGRTAEYFGQTIKDFKDPFVFSTCDAVCSTIEELASLLKKANDIDAKDISVIEKSANRFKQELLPDNRYISGLIGKSQSRVG